MFYVPIWHSQRLAGITYCYWLGVFIAFLETYISTSNTFAVTYQEQEEMLQHLAVVVEHTAVTNVSNPH